LNPSWEDFPSNENQTPLRLSGKGEIKT